MDSELFTESNEKRKEGKILLIRLPWYWENYLLCVLLHMLFPLFPLLIEVWLTGTISAKSLALASSIYTLSIGIS